jgi:hypothetical protein
MDLIEKISRLLNEEEVERMIRWIKTFSENHNVDPEKKGWFAVCVDHMEDEMGEEGARVYCARALDTWKKSTYWRGAGKSEKEAAADVAANPNYPKSKAKKRKIDKVKNEE